MLTKTVLFCLLTFVMINKVECQTTTECNYFEVGDFFGLAFGLFPGQYAAGYCTSFDEGSERFEFECDSSDDGYYYHYDDEYCEGNVSNVTSVSDDTVYECGSTDTCDVYKISFDSYNDTADCDETGTATISLEYWLLDTGTCFPLTFFGFDFAYAVVSFTSSSYTLTYYNESTTCSSGYSQALTFYSACYYSGNDSSTHINITGSGSGSNSMTSSTTPSSSSSSSSDDMSTSSSGGSSDEMSTTSSGSSSMDGTGTSTTEMSVTGMTTTGDDDDDDDSGDTNNSMQFVISIDMVLFAVFSYFAAIFSAV